MITLADLFRRNKSAIAPELNGYEHMMASDNTLEWVRLSAWHCSHHGYECRDCVNWPHPSIIHLTKHFTYPNEFLAAVGCRGLDNRGSTVLRKMTLISSFMNSLQAHNRWESAGMVETGCDKVISNPNIGCHRRKALANWQHKAGWLQLLQYTPNTLLYTSELTKFWN